MSDVKEFPLEGSDGLVVRHHKPTMFEQSAAVYSACENHRVSLWRHFGSGPMLNFLMLNPSTATELENDPTIERCQRRAEAGGFGRLVVTNLFSWRSTDPFALRDVPNPNHPSNDHVIEGLAVRSDMVVCAWGSHAFIRKKLADRVAAVVSRLRTIGVRLHALKLNEDGMPAHPLYLSYDLKPQPWEPK